MDVLFGSVTHIMVTVLVIIVVAAIVATRTRA